MELLRSEPAPLAELEIQADLPLHALRRLCLRADDHARADRDAAELARDVRHDRARAAAAARARADGGDAAGRGRAPGAKSRAGPAAAARASSAPPESGAADPPARATVPQRVRAGLTRTRSGRALPRASTGRRRDRAADRRGGVRPAARSSAGAVPVARRDPRARRTRSPQSYYEMLGVAPNDATSPSRARVHRAGEALRPRSAARRARGHPRAGACAVRSPAPGARGAVRSRTSRAEYDRDLRTGGGMSAKQHALARRSTRRRYYRKAETLLKRADYAGALREVERAMQGGSQARYDALYGWLLYLRSGTAGRVHPRAMEHIDRALKSTRAASRRCTTRPTLLKHTASTARRSPISSACSSRTRIMRRPRASCGCIRCAGKPMPRGRCSIACSGASGSNGLSRIRAVALIYAAAAPSHACRVAGPRLCSRPGSGWI